MKDLEVLFGSQELLMILSTSLLLLHRFISHPLHHLVLFLLLLPESLAVHFQPIQLSLKSLDY
jgi:hypothetical protein